MAASASGRRRSSHGERRHGTSDGTYNQYHILSLAPSTQPQGIATIPLCQLTQAAIYCLPECSDTAPTCTPNDFVVEIIVGGERRPCPLDWLDSFCMRNFTGSAEFDDTLPLADGLLEAGFRVAPAAPGRKP